jgi:imidazolonepropionase-like amidohydrolase
VDGIEHCSFRTADGVDVREELVAAIVTRRVVVGATAGIVPVEGIAPPPGLARVLPQIFAAMERLRRAGAVLVAGTDAGIAPVKPHGVLPHGLVELTEWGMTAVEALRAGTAVAAAVCGLGDRKGRIAAGYDADLLAVAGDPAVDVSALLRVRQVIVGGRPVRPAAADPVVTR